MGMKRSSLSHEQMLILTLSIDSSLLPSKWRLLNVLEFPSTYLPPKKSAITKVCLSLDAAFEVVERNLKTLFLKE